MLSIPWMVILSDQNVKKASFKNFDFRAGHVETLHKHILYQSLGRAPPGTKNSNRIRNT